MKPSFGYLYDGVDVQQLVRNVLRDYFIIQRHPSGTGRIILPKCDRTLSAMYRRPYGHLDNFYADHVSASSDAEPVPLGDFETVIREAGYTPEELMLMTGDDRPPPNKDQTCAISARDQAIIDDRLVNHMTMDAIGLKYGISKERVRQVLKKHGAGGRLQRAS